MTLEVLIDHIDCKLISLDAQVLYRPFSPQLRVLSFFLSHLSSTLSWPICLYSSASSSSLSLSAFFLLSENRTGSSSNKRFFHCPIWFECTEILTGKLRYSLLSFYSFKGHLGLDCCTLLLSDVSHLVIPPFLIMTG